MAFKKTSEGRVFFQGSNGGSGTANDIRPPAKAAPKQAPSSAQGQPTQLQILSLLRSLNEKLKATQTERNAIRAELETYRRSMETFQAKAGQGERAEKMAQETLRELSETRKLFLDLEDRQSGIEKEHQANSEKIRVGVGSYRELVKRVETTEQKQSEINQRQEEIGRKVDEAAAQQARLMRQIEKTIEDRTRFMRKIERIEETVIQTRDALNAKAMVLLTDQNISGAISAEIDEIIKSPAAEPGIPTALPGEQAAAQGWTSSRRLQAAAILLLVVGGILAGWAVSQMQRPQSIDSGEYSINGNNESSTELSAEKTAETAEKVDAIVDRWNVSEDTSAFDPAIETESQPVSPATTADSSDDIGTLDLNDQEKIQAMLETDPDALAAELNKIEPSTPAPDSEETQETKAASLPPTDLAGQVPVTETGKIENDMPAQAIAPVTDAPVTTAPATKGAPVHGLIKPDPGLPPVVKKIEGQAFEGVPEAQHDLAAIYTAGHAGVKQDYKRAMFWFEQSAQSGIANAAYNLGVLHHQGFGTKPDLKKAIEWYTKAADLGHPEAQYNLGIAYIEGVGVEYDPFKANAWFEKAAAQGIMEAAYNLGLIYENGLLGKPQPDQALVWYKEAADKGSPEAKAALEQLAKTLNIGMDDINKLVDNVKLARKGGRKSSPAAESPVKQETRSDITVPSVTTGQGTDLAVLAQIQEHLMGIGLYPGPADGSDSPLSQDAIRAYQQLNGLQPDGRPSAALLVHMLSADTEKTSSVSPYN